ncbi:MAG: glycosyltransferase [Clostridiales bacterium]|nr:glycosyltransferase [Clostridiales bacterium]
MDSLLVFMLVWGVWLITPVLIDGVDAVSRLVVVKTRERGLARRREVPDDELPTVSLIVPAYNEAAVIDRCLTSIKAQAYPHEKFEVIVVDDGSDDGTPERVEHHANGGSTENGDAFRLRGRAIRVGPFRGTITLIRRQRGGKSEALNAGIDASSGEIVINIDSDVVLHPMAIRNIAAAFVRDPKLGALTGSIEIDWDVLESRDEHGRLVLDEEGHIVPRTLTAMERFLAKAQFLEFLSSFDLGRRAQALTGTMFTLAGACSAFRRDILPCGPCYSNTTVSEDTCLTFALHRNNVTIGFAEDAKIYLEPVVTWDELYAQRARWTRGQLEVCGLHEEIIGTHKHGAFSRRSLPKTLLLDHTLAFPRLIWAPLILFFPMFGYSWSVIGMALAGMYAFYVAIEAVNTTTVFAMSDEHTRGRIEQCGWTLLFLPLFRFIVFHFRFSGFLVTLMEEPQWTIQGPVGGMQDGLRLMRVRSIEFVTMVASSLTTAVLRMGRVTLSVLGPLLVTVIVLAGRLEALWKRSA